MRIFGKTIPLVTLLTTCCFTASAHAEPRTLVGPIRPPPVLDWCKAIFNPLFEAASRGDEVGTRVVFNDGSNKVVTYLDGSLYLTAGGNLFGAAKQLSSSRLKCTPVGGLIGRVCEQPFDVDQAGTSNIAITPEGKVSIIWVSAGGGGVDYEPVCNHNNTVTISYETYTGVMSFSVIPRTVIH